MLWTSCIFSSDRAYLRDAGAKRAFWDCKRSCCEVTGRSKTLIKHLRDRRTSHWIRQGYWRKKEASMLQTGRFPFPSGSRGPEAQPCQSSAGPDLFAAPRAPGSWGDRCWYRTLMLLAGRSWLEKTATETNV